jgi:glycosyltransferase involved in cell wall biosynthesis
VWLILGDKRSPTLIKAVNELEAQYNSIRVFCIGTGNKSKECQNFVIDNHLEENVFFLGTVTS